MPHAAAFPLAPHLPPTVAAAVLHRLHRPDLDRLAREMIRPDVGCAAQKANHGRAG